MPRSSFYWHENKPEISFQDLQDFPWRFKIEQILLEHPRYGYRRVTAQLKRTTKEQVNKKKILRLMKKFGLSSISKPKFKVPGKLDKVYPNLTKNLIITRPNQVWASDLTLIITQQGIFYLLAIIDCFTRKIVGWNLSRDYTAESGLKALKMAIKNQIKFSSLKNLIHHSDQGVPYIAKEYTNFLKQNNILISMSRKACPTDNPFIESFFKTVKYDEVYLKEYQDFQDAYQNLKYFIKKDYNQIRLHSSINYQTPAEFERNYYSQKLELLKSLKTNLTKIINPNRQILKVEPVQNLS